MPASLKYRSSLISLAMQILHKTIQRHQVVPLTTLLLAVNMLLVVEPVSSQQRQQRQQLRSSVVQGTAAPLAAGAQEKIAAQLKTLTPMLTQDQFNRAVQGLKATQSGRKQAFAKVAPSGKGDSSSRSPRQAPSNYGGNCSAAGLPPGCITYSNARVANTTVNGTASTANQPVGGMPYVATGRLLIATTTPGSFDSWCSASLIGKGILVTAAHCVHDFGRGGDGWYKSLRFYPAHNVNPGPNGPYGFWDASTWWIPTSYFNGTDYCSVAGVVCQNDVAVVLLKKNRSGKYPGNITQIGYYGYGWNGYGFRSEGSSGIARSQITQLGYPSGLDNGRLMQRGDSQAQYLGNNTSSSPLNLFIGSQMNGGSSGGPWLVNFGTNSALTGSGAGSAISKNIVQGTTSWGYISNTIQIQGASTFAQNDQFPNASYGTHGGGNIGSLVNSACTTGGGQASGACF